MTGTLAQFVTLTTYGNDYIRNGNIPANFDTANTAFDFCNTVDFREVRKKYFFSKPKEEVLFDCPTKWFKFLKNNGCQKLRLYYSSSDDQTMAPDYKLAGMVGGGGTWFIEAVYDTYSNAWASRWEVTDSDSPERKIWSVNYGLVAEKLSVMDLQIDNQIVKEKLHRTLTEIAGFAKQQNLGNWQELFDRAKSILETDIPEKDYYHQDLIPGANYTLISKQLLFAASNAWVFGGMGSWNDLGFDNKEDDQSYEKLSAQLYSNINEAILAAVNSY